MAFQDENKRVLHWQLFLWNLTLESNFFYVIEKNFDDKGIKSSRWKDDINQEEFGDFQFGDFF